MSETPATSRNGQIAVRIVTAVAPLLLTPLVGALLESPNVSFGGGEKDIILIVPWAVWSAVFCVVALLMWRKQAPLGRSLAWSALAAIGGVVMLGFVLLFGIGGRT